MKKYKDYKFYYCNNNNPKEIYAIVENKGIYYFVTNENKSIAPYPYYFLRFMPLISEAKDLSDEYCEEAIRIINDKDIKVMHNYIKKERRELND